MCTWRSVWTGFFLHSYQKVPEQPHVATAECLGDCWTNAFTLATFSGVVMIKGRPDGFFFSAQPFGHPNVHCFSTRNRIMSAKLEPDAKCSLIGTYIAIDRYPFRCCITTTNLTAPSLNTGGFFRTLWKRKFGSSEHSEENMTENGLRCGCGHVERMENDGQVRVIGKKGKRYKRRYNGIWS